MEDEKFIIPHVDKVVGEKDPTRKADLEAHFRVLFRTEGIEKIEDLEIEKTERDLAIIEFVNNSLSNLLALYGRNKKFQVSAEHIHLMEEGGTEGSDGEFTGGGLYYPLSGALLIDRVKSDIDFAFTLFHELLHARSYVSMQLTEKTESKNPELDTFRTGFSVTSRDGKVDYFSDFEEGVIGLLTKRFYEDKISKSELFKDELDASVSALEWGRMEECEKLEVLIDKLWEDNQSSFSSRSEIEDIFINAQLNGQLLPVARLVEGTYGKGRFRELGELTKSIND